MMHAIPLRLDLPGRRVAEYVPGSQPPCYTVDGEPTAIAVRLPQDLIASGWYWSGSFLLWRDPARPDAPGIGIHTGAHPPPGWPSDALDCIAQARWFDAQRAEHAAERLTRPAKKPTRKKTPATNMQRTPAPPAQLAMELA